MVMDIDDVGASMTFATVTINRTGRPAVPPQQTAPDDPLGERRPGPAEQSGPIHRSRLLGCGAPVLTGPAAPRKTSADVDDDGLERAAAVSAAQQALYAARRDLFAAVATAWQSGLCVPRIAARTGLDPSTIRNTLAARGLR